MMNPLDPDRADDNRLVRLGYGAASPLWAPFLLAAGMGAGFWLMTQWARNSYAAQLPGAALALKAAKPNGEAAAEPDLAPAKLDRPEQFMAHNPPPAEMPTEGVDMAPSPVVPPEHVLDHTPAETVEAPANPEVERRIEAAQPVEAEAFDGGEPGGRAALLAETSAAVLGETASFGGDLRADDAASGPEIAAADEDGADLIDAAYAENLGPVPTPGSGSRSRKRRVPPGTAPI